MGLCTSSDGTTWTNRNNDIDFPANGKHGSVFKVSRAVADNLIANAPVDTREIEFDNYATGTNDFTTPANWLGGIVPGINQIAVIQNGHTVNMSYSPTGALSGVKVGQITSGALNISGGTLNITGNIQINSSAVQLDGGAILAASVYGGGTTAVFHFNGGILKARNSTTSFMTGLKTVDVESGGAVIDTNSYNIAISQALTTASATGGLTKIGAGILTLSGGANTYSGSTTISAGTIKLGPNPISIAHRWSFNGSLTDSVGGSNATIVPAGATDVSLSSNPGQVTLAGGSGTSPGYINLGSNLLPDAHTPVTIELWATQKTVQNWSRIFDLGSSDSQNLLMSWTQGTNANSDRVEWRQGTDYNTSDNTNRPYNLNTEYHIIMELNPVGSSTEVNWYSAPSGNANLGSAKGSFTTTKTLVNFTDSADNLGRSFYSADSTANASYNEVRFWNAALSSSALEILHDAGPDANLNSLNLGIAGSLPSTTAVNITGSGATLDLNNFSQTVGSLSGVAGSSVLLGTGTLTIGGNSSTTFSGVISGIGGIIKNGTGTLTLTDAKTFSGAVNLNGGLIKAAALNNLGNGTALNFNGGGLQFSAVFDSFVRSLTFQAGGATLDTQTYNISMANPIGNGGSGGLVKKGTGKLTLNAFINFIGDTAINGGTLEIAGGIDPSGTSLIDVQSGTAVLETVKVSKTNLNINTAALATFEVLNGAHVVGDITGRGDGPRR